MPVTGSLAEHRERLKKQLIAEEKLLLIKRAIDCSELGKTAALMLIKQAIICILHLENPVGENNVAVNWSRTISKEKNCSLIIKLH